MKNRTITFPAAILFCIAMVSTASPAYPQCLLSPDSAGQNGQTRLQNFYMLVDDLYSRDFKPTHQVIIGGKPLQAPPWYSSSTECGPTYLKSGFGLTSPSNDHYLLNGDELSELAVVTALADDDTRMMAIHNTVEALRSPLNQAGDFGLACWIAEVNTSTGTIRCLSSDTATDITARLGLAYYYAANNPNFLASQSLYRAKGDEIAERHLQHEYVHNKCHLSSVTGETLCEWVGGGRNTTAGGVLANAEMWIGYYQDVALFLLAAYESTRNTKFLDRAEEVVDQYLIASNFAGVHLTFGSKKFTWNTSVTPIKPQAREAWDDADAPRALWIGDVLRALSLSTGGAPLTGAYAELSQWVQLVHASGTQKATESCIQYNPDGTVVQGNCGPDYYYNGLGAGLHTYHQTSTLDDKLDRALSQYGWTTTKTWNWANCFGIYRGVRPVKALASAIGLDSTTYGGIDCRTSPPNPSHTLTVSKTGSGSGTVTSSPAGINCGSDCSESYIMGTSVTLTASPAAGSTFTGWSGACSGTGSCQVTMDSAKSVTANFGCGSSVPTAPSWLRVDAVSQSELKLTWQDNSNNETGFKVERKEGCCGPWTLLSNASSNPTGTATYQSTGLKCGTSYAYRVWAFNCAGESAKTNEAARATNACN